MLVRPIAKLRRVRRVGDTIRTLRDLLAIRRKVRRGVYS